MCIWIGVNQRAEQLAVRAEWQRQLCEIVLNGNWTRIAHETTHGPMDQTLFIVPTQLQYAALGDPCIFFLQL